MPDEVTYLGRTKYAINEVTNIVDKIDSILEKGNKQADARKGAIRTINEMVDALRLAGDILSKEISASI